MQAVRQRPWLETAGRVAAPDGPVARDGELLPADVVAEGVPFSLILAAQVLHGQGNDKFPDPVVEFAPNLRREGAHDLFVNERA